MRLLLFGCTGFVGRELLPLLLQAGHQLTVVSRRLARGYDTERADGRLIWMQFDPASSSTWADAGLLDALNQADAVVNLAGEPIAEKRWTPTHRQLLETSRLETTSQLVKAIEACATPPKVLVNASAIGFYGSSLDKRFLNRAPLVTTSLRACVSAGKRRLRRCLPLYGRSPCGSASCWPPTAAHSEKCFRCSAQGLAVRSAVAGNG